MMDGHSKHLLKTQQRCRVARQRGLTLIEVMVVIVIIGILAALIVPNIINRPDQAKVAAAHSDINSIASALELYRLDNNFYPTTEQGLEALVSRPDSSPQPQSWRGYLKRLPKDPWGNLYQYEYPGVKNTPGFDIYSLGANGRQGGEGTDADIGNWEN